MGNSSSTKRSYSTATTGQAEHHHHASAGSAGRALLTAKKAAQQKVVTFKAQREEPAPAPPPAPLLSPGALASLGFTAFLRDNEPAVRRMFDGLRQAIAVERSLGGAPPGPLPSDVPAAEFCNALTRLGYELGWQGNALAPGASSSAVAEKASAKRQMLGNLLPLAGLFRFNEAGERLISWGEYLQVLSMCEAAAAAARGATSDTMESRSGPRDLVETLTSDLHPPPPMTGLQKPVPLHPPPAQAPAAPAPGHSDPSSSATASPTTLLAAPAAPIANSTPAPPTPLPLPPAMPLAPHQASSLSPPRPLEDDVSANLRRQLAASELLLSTGSATASNSVIDGAWGGTAAATPYPAASTAVGGGGSAAFNPSTSLLGASFFPADATALSGSSAQGGMAGAPPYSHSLPPTMYGDAAPTAPAAAATAGSGSSAVRDLLLSPSRIPVYLPRNLRAGASGAAEATAGPTGPGLAAAEAALASVPPPTAAEGRPLTDDDILSAALAGEDLSALGLGEAYATEEGVSSGAGSGTALWGGGLKGAQAVGAATSSSSSSTMHSSLMYKPLASVLVYYQDSLDVLFNYFAFQQKKPSGVTGGAGETFEAYAAKGYSVNKAAFQRCSKFLGLIGTVGNGQAVLLSKQDLEAVWADMVRIHKQQVSPQSPLF
jgi:hypothetical protein